jgi:lysophospholipase L1-like esterase
MKIRTFIILLLPLLLAGFKMQTKKKIVFFGDSITQQGADTGGFIRKIDSMLTQNNKTNYELIGAGVSGNKVYDLYLRMDSDVLLKNPDAVLIYIGVNDVWHKMRTGTGTDPDKFEKFYSAIIKKLKDRKIAVFLCTPALIGEKNDFSNQQDGDMNLYAGIVRKLARVNDCPLIDLRQAFLDHLKNHNPDNKDRGILTKDGVHLNRAGNNLVAQLMYQALSRDFIK